MAVDDPAIIKYIEPFQRFLKDCYWNELLELANEYPDRERLRVKFKDIYNKGGKGEYGNIKELLEKSPLVFFEAGNEALQTFEDLPFEIKFETAQIEIEGHHLYAGKLKINDLSMRHLGKFVSLEGMIKQTSDPKQRITKAAFQCLRCGHVTMVDQVGPKFEEPFAGCEEETCGKKGPFRLIVEESKFVDSQSMIIQDLPYGLKNDRPRDIKVVADGLELTSVVSPGERVILSGVLRSRQITLRDGKSTSFEMVLELNNIEHLEEDYQDLEISKEDEKEIMELSQDPELYEKVIKSIAPAIYGHEDVKEAIALQLFSGVEKIKEDGTHLRGDPHVMLMGDPGIAKSQILRYVAMLSGGVYASGKSASGVGLTAAVVPDELNKGGWTYQAGALVMANERIACIDEMDKMKDDDRSALHEAMEQQTITLHKAGISAVFRTSCPVLGAANPKYGRFDRYENLAEQAGLTPALLSRFDLIFLMLDVPNKETDERIVNHILKAHEAGAYHKRREKGKGEAPKELIESKENEVSAPIDIDLFRKYIAYAKKEIIPVFDIEDDSAWNAMVKFYNRIRNSGKGNDAPVPITARSIEAVRRLAEASAKIRLSQVITLEDVQRATRIITACLKDIGTDPETGEIDADIIDAGISKRERDKIKVIKDIVRLVADRYPGKDGGPIDEVYAELEKTGISKEQAKKHIAKMKEKGDVFTPSRATIKLVIRS